MVAQAELRSRAEAGSALMVERLRALVECESPSGVPELLTDCSDLLTAWGDAATGRSAERPVARIPHLLWRAPDPMVLLLGHFDTVWPAGTIVDWPLTVRDGAASGPGVFDMKAGIIQMLAAVDLVADRDAVSVLLTCDEEVGSRTSRALIEEEAARAGVVLVCEPSADGGAVKIARKGTADYRVLVRGRAAHAGLEPELGVNATREIARQILVVERFAADELGTSVTPTLLASGTTTNTVPAEARLHVDVRSWTRDELERVDAAMQALRTHLPDAALTVEGGVNRYPLEPAVALRLLELTSAAANDVGLPAPEGVRSGGGSDGNFTGALGIPTLDGLGAVGAHPHARSEWVDVTAMPARAALLAALIDRVCAGRRQHGPRWLLSADHGAAG